MPLTLSEAKKLAHRIKMRLLALLPDCGWSRCGRCGVSWRWGHGHDTPYQLADDGIRRPFAVGTDGAVTIAISFGGRACFPLCEECWQGLTPATRLPYYEALVADWIRQGDDGAALPAIRAAVLAGK
jgi:hypothetical protein